MTTAIGHALSAEDSERALLLIEQVAESAVTRSASAIPIQIGQILNPTKIWPSVSGPS
jgi:hypothetical protein